ncbi:ABC superfamily ATP binding cassette transporter, membrane protein [Weissella oryzae SG25]|uniref:ABC superfamily ATP binding cassette transporter, membrane protein n=1 Tax=Weissella oryzae (strain DSM 25784 / JCM 18191 / LMG 30913 / SG25) TaxID=1329250 RepID=A0A069CS89_WEIOS|nr:ABC transporter permease [Weissella oryzae]GAK30289.1 ABC superfamily ATP binding cassette transporter, membrane protein [Weissella oryzae SG25]
MKILTFKRRLHRQWQQYSKYLRYVFNDHAVIALLILLGAGLVAYRQILLTLPKTLLMQVLALALLGLTLSFFWRGATFILPADPVYLLADEGRLRKIKKAAGRYSIFWNVLVQALMTLVLMPLLLRLFAFTVTLLLFAITLLAKISLTYANLQKVTRFTDNQTNLIDWEGLVNFEQARRQRVLNFFNMFIDVPGLQVQIKRRAWLEPFSSWLEPKQKTAIGLIMTQTFVRQPQYLSSWLRLTLFGCLIILFSNAGLGNILLAFLLYLMILQWLPLLNAQQHIVFDIVFPINDKTRIKGFMYITSKLMLITTLVWMIVGLVITRLNIIISLEILGLGVLALILEYAYLRHRFN